MNIENTTKISLTTEDICDAIIYWLTNAKDIGGIGSKTQVKLEDNEAEVTIYSKQD